MLVILKVVILIGCKAKIKITIAVGWMIIELLLTVGASTATLNLEMTINSYLCSIGSSFAIICFPLLVKHWRLISLHMSEKESVSRD